ncbi:RagB/SusD family nutrient uptake outer membrane protein [Sphingobacterium paludis]|uniref:SusD-like starch-binding protein associating with outer membrane n=1 Tax=Sphingobacterium paludis TaxID=1476465 RepID=A0A4R7CTD8_9SPHI|nr:RagB/SusD family nutrient uptake outer membrane protein [Sphingobacterium paludis]TDS08886.1 SusD-like starch-binding protein associating with outer membrane [Sphingobacterium paludis]
MKNIFIFALVFLHVSCKEFLDVKPVGRLIPSQVEDFENILNSSTTLDYHFFDNNRGSSYAFLGDNFTISDNQARFLYVSTHPNIDRYAAFTFYRPYLDPNKPQYTWEWGIYSAVGLFNTVISGVAELKATETELGKTVVAQAKAGRAWSYMVATMGYGPIYDPNGDNSAKVLPFRVSADPSSANPQLSTTRELFDLIEEDLQAALDAPAQVSNPSRADKTAVYGLRAMFYMYKRDWAAVVQNANEAWELAIAQKGGPDGLIYDYNTFSYNVRTGASPPPGVDVEVSSELVGPDQNLQQTYHRENLFYRIAPQGTEAYPSDDFLDNFDKENDRRYQLFALKSLGYNTKQGVNTYSDGVVIKYYKGAKMNINQGLTYPELILMRAEANARLNNLPEALADINLLRKYRYSGNNRELANGTELNQDQLLQEILNERRRELPIESFQRTFDIKRLALDTGKPWCKSTVVHRIGDREYTAPVNNEFFSLPISNIIIQFNPQWGLPLDNRPYLPKDQ